MASKGRLIFLTIWSVITGGLVFSIIYEPPEQLGGPKIGIIQDAAGTVQVKPDAQILWRDAGKGFLLGYNDSISTGSASSTTINISNAKPITLGPNSVVTIRSSKGSKKELLIQLERGVLEAAKGKVAKNNQTLSGERVQNIKIRAGKSTFSLGGTNTELTIVKDKINSEAKVVKASGNITVRKKGSASLSKLGEIHVKGGDTKTNFKRSTSQGFEIDLKNKLEEASRKKLAAKTPLEPEKKKPKKKKLKSVPQTRPEPPKVDLKKYSIVESAVAKKFVPEIVFPKREWVAWTQDSLEKVKRGKFTLNLTKPRNRPPALYAWAPAIIGLAQGKFNSKEWVGRGALKAQKISINLAQAQDVATITQFPFQQLTISLRPGAHLINRQTKKREKAYGEPFRIRIRSLSALGTGQILLRFGKWDFNPISRRLLWEKPFDPVASIWLKSASDLFRIRGLIKPGKFSLSRPRLTPRGRGIYIVKNYNVIGQVKGMLKKEHLNRLRQKLEADFIFKGMANAYIGGLAQFNAANAKGSLPDKIYILNSGKFIAISQKFLKENKSVQQFLDSNTAAFFRSPIKAISFK